MTNLHEANSQGGAQALWKASKSKTVDDRPFAILRYAKLKSTAAIKGASAHMRRTIDTPNADPSRTAGNIILHGSPSPFADVDALLPKLGQRKDPNDPKSKLLRRSNSVLAVEVLMTASPEWWQVATTAEKNQWVERSATWLAKEWGAANVAHLELHMDETTPHLTGFIVPLDEEGGLNARQFIGGKASKAEPGSSLISGHQTRYAASVEPLGLRRGRLGSDATHETMRSYQRRAKGVMDEVSPPEVGIPPLMGREKWAEDLQARINEQFKTMAVRAAETSTQARKAKAASETADKALKDAEAAKAARRALADRCRELDLATVLEDLGFEYDKAENRWKFGPKGARDHRIEVTDQKWRCAVLQSGGRGAIDLVKSVQGTDFNGALAYLANRYGLEATAADLAGHLTKQASPMVANAAKTRQAFKLPEEAPERWPEVRQHLIQQRGLDSELVDTAFTTGDIYAQEKPGQHGPMVNAVFVCRDAAGIPTGAEIKATRPRPDGSYWGACAIGTDKKAGSFRAGLREIGSAARVVVVESAIDALSCLSYIRREKNDYGPVTVISTAGDGPLPKNIASAIHPNATKYAGQDANLAGDRQARRLGKGWRRFKPPSPHEDWNAWAQAAFEKMKAAIPRRKERPSFSEPEESLPSPSDPNP